MPLDDAIGGRMDCITRPSRLTSWASRVFGSFERHDSHRKISASLVVACAAVSDCAVSTIAAIAAATICESAGIEGATGGWLIASFLAVAVALELQRRLAAYSLVSLRNARARLGRMMLANLLAGVAGAACLTMVANHAQAWVLWLPVWCVVSFVVGGLAVGLSVRQIDRLIGSGRLARHVAVIGSGEYARGFVDDLREQPGDFVRYAGRFDDEDQASSTWSLPDNGHVTDLLFQAHRSQIDSVVLCVPVDQTARIARLRAQLRKLNCDIYVAAEFVDLTLASRTADLLGRRRVIKIAGRPLGDWQLLQKTVCDRIGAAVMLAVLAPVLMLIALAISLDSDGPVLFRQPRVGLNNRPFTMFKFRTMYHHQADLHGHRQATRNDPRVTRIGWFLRRTSLDELPQLLNVLLGTMSLVGPRPHASATKAAGRLFADVVADYSLRHRVKPGITGWAQVNGWRGETTTSHQIEQRVAHDLYYIDHWSLLLDTRIMFMTLLKGLSNKAAF